MTARALNLPTEADVQRQICRILSGAGCHVYSLSQGYRPGGRRHGTTRQTRGLADLYVLCPRRQMAFWVECKRPGGKLRDEQLAFQLRNMACRVPVVVGGTSEVIAFLRKLGLVAADAR